MFSIEVFIFAFSTSADPTPGIVLKKSYHNTIIITLVLTLVVKLILVISLIYDTKPGAYLTITQFLARAFVVNFGSLFISLMKCVNSYLIFFLDYEFGTVKIVFRNSMFYLLLSDRKRTSYELHPVACDLFCMAFRQITL